MFSCQEQDARIKYDKEIVQNTFVNALKTGLRDDNIRGEQSIWTCKRSSQKIFWVEKFPEKFHRNFLECSKKYKIECYDLG